MVEEEKKEEIRATASPQPALAVPAEPASSLDASRCDQAHEDIYDRLWEANVRIEAMWPFPVGPASDDLMEAFEQAGEDLLPPEIAALIANWDEDDCKNDLFDGNQDAFEELFASAFRRNLKGWIGVAAVPVFTRSGSGASFSWGYYSTKMIFARTADELLSTAAAWGEAQYEAATKALGK